MVRGSITKVKGKRVSWRVRIELPRAMDGSRVAPLSRSFTTRKEAEAFRLKVIAEMEGGVFTVPTGLRLAEYLNDQWLPFYRAQRKTSSYLKREKDVRVHIIPRLGSVKLDALTPAMIQRFYDELGQSLAPQSVCNVAETLSAALNAAVRWELTRRNPCRGATKPPVPRRQPTLWTPEQFRAFLAAEDDPHWRLLFALLATTGMRKAEVLALRWEDIDAERGAVRIERALTYAGKGVGFIIGPPKTRDSRRVVALPDALLTLLREARGPQESESDQAVSKGDPSPIFVSHTGRPLSLTAIDWRWKRTARRAGLPLIRLHDLRHGNATIGLAAGIPLKVISERLGHATIGITADVYAHVTHAIDREAANVIGGLLLGDVQDAAE